MGGGALGGTGGRPPPRSNVRLAATGDDDALPFPAATIIRGVVIAVTAAAAVYVVPIAARVFLLWACVLPILVRYGFHFGAELLRQSEPASREARRRRLHAQFAPHALAIINKFGGGYVKVGQVCSNRPDLLPTAYVQAFSSLQDNAKPMPWARVRRIIDKQVPGGIARFEQVDPEPIGCASIAQVHRARLTDSAYTSDDQFTDNRLLEGGPPAAGSNRTPTTPTRLRGGTSNGDYERLGSGGRDAPLDVVLKVQRPGAASLFLQDLRNIQILMRVALPPMAPVVAEIRKRFATEFDLRREAENMAEIGANMRRAFPRKIVVPRAVVEMSSRHVCVMEFLRGRKLTDELTRDVSSAIGSFNFERAKKRLLLGDAEELSPAPLAQRARLALGMPRLWLARARGARRLRTLARAMGQQVLIDGVFNGDPHAGNVLCVPGGRPGLIDFGQVKRLSPEQRLCLAQLILALADRDDAAAVRAFQNMGFRSRDMSPAVALRLSRLMYDHEGELKGQRPSAFLRQLGQVDAIQRFPLEYVMAARVSLLLRGLGMGMGTPVEMAQLWRPFAVECIRRAGGR